MEKRHLRKGKYLEYISYYQNIPEYFLKFKAFI